MTDEQFDKMMQVLTDIRTALGYIEANTSDVSDVASNTAKALTLLSDIKTAVND